MKFTVKRAWQTVCRKFFALISGNSSPTKQWIPFDVAPGERLSPYLTDRDEYSAHKKIVRFTAFIPPKSLRKSVYWTSGMVEDEIWSLGDEFVAPSRGQIHGRADFNSYSMSTNIRALAIDLTGKPHPRHADIVGWDDDRKKRRLQAERLADDAVLVMRPPPV
ncbi:MAG TPA: hypothetical protein VEL04_09580 [Burkholderiales bacterium]|nr:hypothetical protein [Burkholderiales bacterium]